MLDTRRAIRVETLQGRTATILGQACGKPVKPGDACLADDRTDINVAVPDGFIVSETSSVKARRVVLTVATLAPECREDATLASEWPGVWTVSPGTFESASYDGNSTPSRITIVFRLCAGIRREAHFKPLSEEQRIRS